MQDGAKEFFPTLSLQTTRQEQCELSSKLTVKPFAEIIGSAAYTRLKRGNAESKVNDPIFTPFFDPNASGREYYQDGDTLVVKENIRDSKIYTLAVFVKSDVKGQGIRNPSEVTFRHGDVDGKVEYLRVKKFCLVNENEEAVDLAAPWYSQSEISGEKRRIGLLKYNSRLSKDQAEAIVRSNSILLTDSQSDVSYEMRDALGIKDIPSLSKWLGRILAGVKSTQKETDLSKIEYMAVKSRALDPAKLRTAEGLLEQAELVAELKDAPNELLSVIMPRALTGRLSMVERVLYAPILASKNAEKIGFHELIRLERNAAASTLYFIRQLRQSSFDLFPGISNEQLIQTVESTLKAYDKLYPKASQYGIQFASLMDVGVFVDSMKKEYDTRQSQPDFNEDQFVEEFFQKYAQLQRDNRARLTSHKI